MTKTFIFICLFFISGVEMLFASDVPAFYFDCKGVEAGVTSIYSGGTASSFKANLLNGAKVQAMGKYNVIDLGANNGYLDMTSSAGNIVQQLKDFSVSCYYRVKEGTNISGAGNFLWAFCDNSACGASSGKYTAYRLNVQRIATTASTGGYSNEKGHSVGTASETGKWIHVVYTQTGGSGKLYIDGIQKGSMSSMPELDTLFTSVPRCCWLGRPQFSSDNYLHNTLIYNFAVYNYALTATEVKEMAVITDTLDYEYRYGAGADFSALKKAVEDAEAYLASAENGGFPSAAIEDYRDVVVYSRAILDQHKVAQSLVDEQVKALTAAKTTLDAVKGFTFLNDFSGVEYDTNRGFIHPGGIHTNEDFERVKQLLASHNDEVTQGYNNLINSSFSAPGTYYAPTETVIRGGADNYINCARAAGAAYQQALRWKIDGNEQCAKSAIRILNDWAKTCKYITGDSNQNLARGLYGYQFAEAGELLRDYDGWDREDFKAYQKWMRDVWYSGAMWFLRDRCGTWANTSKWWQAPGHYWSNWPLSNLLCCATIGILCDDVFIYNQAMSFFKYDQVGTYHDPKTADNYYNGAIKNDGLTDFLGNLVVTTHEWEQETGAYGKVGQMNESGRDGGHCGLALGLAVDIAHTGWNQGDDLFSYMNHRLAAGIEYVAAQTQSATNLPWDNYWDITNGLFCSDSRCWQMTGPALPAQIRGYWGTIIGHYEGVKGVKMPWAEKAYSAMGVDGGCGGSTSGGYDHLGYSVLMNTRANMATYSTAPTELTYTMTYDGKTINHNELGGLTNTFNTTAEKKRSLPKGTVITLSPNIAPDSTGTHYSTIDTGNWEWNTGEKTREITITANKSFIYRVCFTNEYGVKSYQAFPIAVQGDCQETTITPTITVNSLNIGTANADGTEVSAQASYGSNVILSMSPVAGYGNFEWENGKLTESITINSITHDRTITGCFISQGGKRNYVTFKVSVTPVIPTYTINDGDAQSIAGDIYVNEGDNVKLSASVAEALSQGSWKWDDGQTTEEIELKSIAKSQNRSCDYTVNGTTFHQEFNVLVQPKTTELLETGNYQIRLRGTNLYLTGYGLKDTVRFAYPDNLTPKSQQWQIVRYKDNPYYDLVCLCDSSKLKGGSTSLPVLTSYTYHPYRITLAKGSEVGSLWITKNSAPYYLLVNEDGTMYNTSDSGSSLNATADFPGYLYEFIRIITGDVNGDGLVDISDVNSVISIICGGTEYAENADVNGDGKIDISDVTAIISIICNKN